jgi:ankyrin repeat protein
MIVGVGFVLTLAAVLPIDGCDFSLSLGDPCASSDDRFITSVVAGDADAVRDELDGGADANARVDDVTPLRCAVNHHQTQVVALLIDHGARANNSTFVEQAVRSGDVEIVRLLLDAGSPQGPALLEIAAGGRPVDLAPGFTPDATPVTPEEAAAITDLLLARGVDPNTTVSGPTPLLWAAFNGRAAMVQLLLDHGAEPNHGGVVDRTLIQFAQLPVGNGDLVPQPSGPIVANVPPLVAAAWTGNVDVATALLAAGADPNLAADEAFTAIYAAAVLGNDAMVQILLDGGADAFPAVREGVMTPADAARAANHPGTAQLLETHAG